MTRWEVSRDALNVIDGCATPDQLARSINMHPDHITPLLEFLEQRGEIFWDETNGRYWTTDVRLPHPGRVR